MAKLITTDILFKKDKENFPYKTKISRNVAKRLLNGNLPKIGYEKKVISIPSEYKQDNIIYKSTKCLYIQNLSG